jgi:phage tail protein X
MVMMIRAHGIEFITGGRIDSSGWRVFGKLTSCVSARGKLWRSPGWLRR